MSNLRRAVQLARSTEGRRRIARAAVGRAALALGPDLLVDDYVNLADLADLENPWRPDPPRPAEPGSALDLAFVTTPPAVGSGGHTTLFRMISACEHAGHRTRLLIYDPFRGSPDVAHAHLREGWPEVRAGISSLDDGYSGADLVVTSAWQTAHATMQRAQTDRQPARLAYFIQDFEPFFAPRGFVAALAESSYRLGLHPIALGQMVARHLRTQCDLEPDVIDFGCDLATYRQPSRDDRYGVVFYARPSAARRGYGLAVEALRIVAEQRPDIPIYGYGQEQAPHLSFPMTWHGRLSPSELASLYGRSVCGLALSFTNISLVAGEMAAAGCVPIINDSPDARADLPNEAAEWAPPTPRALAARIIATHDGGRLSRDRSERSVAAMTRTWEDASRDFLTVVDRLCYAGGVASER